MSSSFTLLWTTFAGKCLNPRINSNINRSNFYLLSFRSGFAAQWVNLTSQAVLLVIMIITVLCAYRQITKLDINIHAVSLLDDLLLFLCLPSFFLYTIFTVVPAMAHQDYYAIVVCSLQVSSISYFERASLTL